MIKKIASLLRWLEMNRIVFSQFSKKEGEVNLRIMHDLQ